MSNPNELDDIRARAAAAAPGPWWWGGNIDHHGDVGLRGRKPGYGVIDILRNSREDIDKESAGREWDSTDASEWIDRAGYVKWRTQNPKDHLAFLREDVMFVEHGRDLAIFEVARNQGLPDDTPRDHPKVYRGDVVGIRNANAEFIAHARADIPYLINEIDRLQAQLAAVEAHNAQFLVDHSTHEPQHCDGGPSWTTRAARDLDAILHPIPQTSTPVALADGTLDLGWGSLWSIADLDEWREEHLPGCATCIATYGQPTNERSI